jgi:2-aminoadipate transaminase
MSTLWTERFAQRTSGMRRSEVRELLKLTDRPDVISFGGGMPAPELFPLERVEEACAKVLRDHGAASLQYSATEGYRPLRELIAGDMFRSGVRAAAENVLITAGSQQALDLIGKVFINPGDHVLVERPTYLGALQAWNAYQAQYLTVPIDDDGVRVDEVEAVLRGGPKFVYALPTFQNPTGVTLSLDRRHRLLEVARELGVPIVEDDPYGQLRYEGDHLAPLVALDADNVIYMSTLSKTLAPGLRLGWMIAPVSVIDRLVQAKQGTDLHTSTFTQYVAYEIASSGFLDGHVATIRAAYRTRRDAMTAAMAEHFPAGVTWTQPQGGLFVWVRFPSHVDAAEVLKAALQQDVAFLVGSAFFVDGSGQNTARFNFSNASVERIQEGIRRIGRVLQRFVQAPVGNAVSASSRR